MSGQIQLIIGPMFSGKTTELIRRIKRYETANQKCMVVKYAKDNRYDTENLVLTHDKRSINATVKTTKLGVIHQLASGYSVIGIDEGQFFKDIVEFSEEMANAGKIVVIAALDGTYQRKMFGDILSLIPMSESVMKLTSVCMSCFGDAAFTKRISHEKQVELIGGKESYLSVCRACYHGNQEAIQERKQLVNLTNSSPTSNSKTLKSIGNSPLANSMSIN